MMIVQKFSQLLAQTLVRLALVAEHDGALEQRVLQLLRQCAPKVGGSRAQHQKITGRDVVDDLIGVLTHVLALGRAVTLKTPILGRDQGKDNAGSSALQAA
jgi:hypothetical protein